MDSVTRYLRLSKPIDDVVSLIARETGKSYREIIEYILERHLRLDLVRGIDLELAIDEVRSVNAERAAKRIAKGHA